MKINPLIQTIFTCAIITVLISACVPQPQAIEPTMQTASPTQAATQVVVNAAGLQPITPENIQDMELLYELGVGHSYDAALSPDGKNIAVLTKYKIIVYDLETFEEKYTVPVEISDNSAITFSPDGKQIVYSNTHGITFLNANDGTHFNGFPFGRPFANIVDIFFIPENNRIIVIGINYDTHFGDFCFMLFDQQGHKLFDREYSNRGWNYLFRYIDTQKTALLIYQKGEDEVFPNQTFIIDNETGNVLAADYKVHRFEQPVEETIIGSQSYLPSQAEIEQWVNEHESIPIQKQFPNCNTLPKYQNINVLSQNEKTALLEFKEESTDNIDDTNIRIEEIDLQTCSLIRHIDFPSVLNNGIFSPDDKFFVENNEFSTYVWDLSDGSMWLEFPGNLSGFPSPTYGFNQDGSKFLIGPDGNNYDSSATRTKNNTITIYDTNTGNITNTLPLSGSMPNQFDLTYFPELIIFDTEIWNINTAEKIGDIPYGPILLDPSRNGFWVLSSVAAHDFTPQLYDLTSGVLLKEFPMIHTTGNTKPHLIEDNSILEISFDGQAEEKDFIRFDITSGEIIEQKIHEAPPIEDEEHTGYQGTELSQYLFSESENKEESYKQEIVKQVIGPFIIDSSIQHARWTDPKWHSFWDSETGDYLGFFRTDFAITNFIISPNHYYLAAIGSDGIIRIYGVKEE
jgi:WD40 repeat protein